MAVQASAYVRALTTLVENSKRYRSSSNRLPRSPHSRIIGSFPGLGTVRGARILGETGDDHTRFATARGLKAFAGTAPITRASERKRLTTMRVVRNTRHGQAASLWSLPCWPSHRAGEPTTTAGEPPATATPPLPATSPTAVSACGTTASPPAPPTTRARPSRRHTPIGDLSQRLALLLPNRVRKRIAEPGSPTLGVPSHWNRCCEVLLSDSTSSDHVGLPPYPVASSCCAQPRSRMMAATVAVSRSGPTQTMPWLTRNSADDSPSVAATEPPSSLVRMRSAVSSKQGTPCAAKQFASWLTGSSGTPLAASQPDRSRPMCPGCRQAWCAVLPKVAQRHPAQDLAVAESS